MDEFLKFLKTSGMYTIARLPALRDYEYGLNHVVDGLHHSSRGYLWQDDDGCYWLDPNSDGTLNYLGQQVAELKTLGFDEVVFTDFYVPDNGSVYFDGDRTQVLEATANSLVNNYASNSFAVSFVSQAGFTLPDGRSRLFVENAEPSDAANIAAQTGFEVPEVYLAFITELHDTRFDAYSVLRPLSAAH